MGKHLKLINRILKGTSDASINFQELCNLLVFLGFDFRIKGGHHLFRHGDLKEMINLQRDGNNAKPYQVKQVRNLILKHKLGEQANE